MARLRAEVSTLAQARLASRLKQKNNWFLKINLTTTFVLEIKWFSNLLLKLRGTISFSEFQL
jgi:hypothetical protein